MKDEKEAYLTTFTTSIDIKDQFVISRLFLDECKETPHILAGVENLHFSCKPDYLSSPNGLP